MKKQITIIICALSLTGCAHTLKPTAAQQAPSQWQHSGSATSASWPTPAWWQQFDSQELLRLQRMAEENSTQLGAMAARVLQADQQLKISGVSKVPTVDASMGIGHTGRVSGGSETQNLSADLAASYEVDLWGKLSAERQAAQWQWQGTQFEQQALMISVAAEVGQRYVDYLGQQERLRIAKLQLRTAEDVLRVVRARVNAGAVSPMDLLRQDTQLARQKAALHPLEQRVFQERLELATLLGVDAEQLALTGELGDLRLPNTTVGLPSELLLRRPDLQQEEAKLRVAEANVAVARTAMFPSIRLTASTGQRGDTWSELWRGGWIYNIGASLTQPIFQGGRLKAEHKLSQAKQIELLENYRGVLLTAFSEVEIALRNMDNIAAEYTAQEEVLASSQELFRLAESRYREGADDLLSLLEAQQSLYSAQDNLLVLKQQRLQAHITLFRMLGGGWEQGANA